MTLAALILSHRDWLWPLAGLMVLVVALLAWSYRPTSGGVCRWLCPALKAGGFAVLAFCLLEPLFSSQRARPGANLFAVVADNSQGMQLKDAGEDRTRGEQLRALLGPQPGGWLEKLSDTFDVRRYYFDTRLQPTRDFSELDDSGRASSLGAALRSLGQRYEGRPLAGVLLFTDGNATDLRGVPEIDDGTPIYPVIIGSTDPVPDLALDQVRVAQTDFEDAPVSLQAEVKAAGFQQDDVVARILDEAGQTVAEQRLTVRLREQLLTFRFQLRPQNDGLTLYRVVVRAAAEREEGEPERTTREATLANNDRVVVVQRGRGPYRVLYVAGRPNWEYKYLNRALEEDRQLEMVGLIRVARREPKFNFIGRSGETSNPLYRGFGDPSAEEVERYDQPVLVRLNTRDAGELNSGFPQTPEALYAYHAVIVDDLEAAFFKPDQAMLLQKFVSERGGGFLMLGGMESFREGGYQRTPIGDMLPVYLDPVDEAQPGAEVKMSLTREGLLQAWARLRETESEERQRLDQMRTFKVMNRVSGVRPGATVVATALDADGRPFPALVHQRFGQGRAAALTVGDLWLWGLRDAASRKDLEKAWRQLLRWLVNDAPNRLELAAEPLPEADVGSVRLDLRARDEAFRPLENAAVRLVVEPLLTGADDSRATNITRLVAEPSESEPGLYQAQYLSRQAGGYRATAYVTNDVGVQVGVAQVGWSTDPAGEEFRSTVPNVALLEELARRTGGEIVRPDRLAEFSRGLPNRQAPVMEPWTRPFWHTPAMFLFAVFCLVSEWGLRRWKGLP